MVNETLGGTMNETTLEEWKEEMTQNVDQFFLMIMGFIIYCKYFCFNTKELLRRNISWQFWDNFAYISIKTYVVGTL